MKTSIIAVIVVGCLIIALVASYGSGLFGNKSPAKETDLRTINSPQAAPGPPAE